MSKPNCYDCKWRRDLAGDAHSQCVHPKIGGEKHNVVGLASFMAGIPLLGVKGSPYGIRNGWFMWPLNFDPIWLESCEGFTSQKKEGDVIDRTEKLSNVP